MSRAKGLAFHRVAADRLRRRGSAGHVDALEGAVAAVEAGDEARAPLRLRIFRRQAAAPSRRATGCPSRRTDCAGNAASRALRRAASDGCSNGASTLAAAPALPTATPRSQSPDMTRTLPWPLVAKQFVGRKALDVLNFRRSMRAHCSSSAATIARAVSSTEAMTGSVSISSMPNQPTSSASSPASICRRSEAAEDLQAESRMPPRSGQMQFAPAAPASPTERPVSSASSRRTASSSVSPARRGRPERHRAPATARARAAPAGTRRRDGARPRRRGGSGRRIARSLSFVPGDCRKAMAVSAPAFDASRSSRHLVPQRSIGARSKQHVRTVCADRNAGGDRSAVRRSATRGFSAALQHRADAADPAGHRRAAPRPGSNLPDRRAMLVRWGLIPGWTKNPNGAAAAFQRALRDGGRKGLVPGRHAPPPRADPGLRLLRMAARRLEAVAGLLGAAEARRHRRLRRADGDLRRAGRLGDRHRARS